MYISGTRGGPVRLSILKKLSKDSTNINKLASEMKLDYKTVQHHMRTLEKNNFVIKQRNKNEIIYKLSPILQSNKEIIDEINGVDMGKSK